MLGVKIIAGGKHKSYLGICRLLSGEYKLIKFFQAKLQCTGFGALAPMQLTALHRL